MKMHNSIPVLLLSAAMAVPAAAETGRTAITATQVAAAIGATGLKVSPRQITLLAKVVASKSDPALRVDSMERWGDHRMKVRLECASTDECLPFLVAIESGSDTEAQSALADFNQVSASVVRPKSVSNPIVLRAGSAAILLLDGGHVHIELPVISLENGAIGQKIHVASSDRKQTYTAEVVDGQILKGKL